MATQRAVRILAELRRKSALLSPPRPKYVEFIPTKDSRVVVVVQAQHGSIRPRTMDILGRRIFSKRGAHTPRYKTAYRVRSRATV
jgi:hypothetical protein